MSAAAQSFARRILREAKGGAREKIKWALETALAHYGSPLYVYHEIVHNRYVVESLKSKGAVFVEHLAEVPAGSTVIFSAHGVSQGVRREAEARGLKVFDATCPLVTKVHMEAIKFAREGYHILLVGHEGHDEVIGTMGQLPEGSVRLVETLGGAVSGRKT